MFHTLVILLPLFCHAFVHFHHSHSKGHAFSKCNGIEDLLGVSEITSDPEKARAGHDISFRIKGKLLKDVTNPVCRVKVRSDHVALLPCKSDIQCPMGSGSEWSTSTKVHVPGKAEALAGQKIKIQVQCHDSEAGNTNWDDKAPKISCIETSIKVSFWLGADAEAAHGAESELQEPEQLEPEVDEEPATLQHESARTPDDIVKNPWILAPVIGGMALGFALAATIIYWRIRKRPRREVDEIWSATLVQTDIYVDFEENQEGTQQIVDGAI